MEILTPVAQVPQAFSTIGATTYPLRFFPSLMLQYGIQFIALAVPSWIRDPAKFAPWYRGIGTTVIVLGLLVVESNGQLSAFTAADVHTIEIAYKVIGAIVLAGLVAWGIRKDQRLVMQIGSAGAVLYLFMRLVDWFWDWVPQWLFFLLVGAFALSVLLVLRRMRRSRAEVP